MKNSKHYLWSALVAIFVASYAQTSTANICRDASAELGGGGASKDPIKPVEAVKIDGQLAATPQQTGPTNALALGITQVKSLPPMEPDAIAAQRAFAGQFVQGLAEFDPSNIRQANQFRDGMRSFNKSVIALSPTIESTSLATTIKALSTSAEGKSVGDLLLNLNKTMDSLDFPKTFEEPTRNPFKLFGRFILSWIPGARNTIENYFGKFRTAEAVYQEQIGHIKDGIRAEEHAIDNDYQVNADALNAARVKLYDVDQFLKILEAEVQTVYDGLDPNSERAKFIKKEVMTHLADRRNSVNEMINTLQQAESALIILIDSGRELTVKASDEVAKAQVAIESGVVIAVAINRQATLRRGAEAIRTTGQDIQEANARNLLAHSLATNKFLIDSANIDRLVATSEVYAQVRAEREQAQAARLQAFRTSIPKLEQLRADFERMIQEQRREIGLDSDLDPIQNGGGNNGG